MYYGHICGHHDPGEVGLMMHAFLFENFKIFFMSKKDSYELVRQMVEVRIISTLRGYAPKVDLIIFILLFLYISVKQTSSRSPSESKSCHIERI